MTPILGAISDHELQDLLAQMAKLQGWQAKLAGAAKVKSGVKGPKIAKPRDRTPPRLQQEFGVDMDFHVPRLGPLPDEAMLDDGPGSSGQAVPVPNRQLPFFANTCTAYASRQERTHT